MSESLGRPVHSTTFCAAGGSGVPQQRKPCGPSQALGGLSASGVSSSNHEPVIGIDAGAGRKAGITSSQAVPIRCAKPETAAGTAGLEGAEIRRILQHGVSNAETPQTTFLGVSPPTRSMGAANPLVQDALWQRDPYRASHCNLQALREMDARGGSFLRAGSRGDYRLLIGSPDVGALSGLAEVAATDERCFTAAVGGGLHPHHNHHHRGASPGGYHPAVVDRTSPGVSCQTAWFV